MYEKKGCQFFIGAVMLLVIIGFVGPMFLPQNASVNGQPVMTVVEVGGKPGTSEDLRAISTLTNQQMGAASSPRQRFDQEAAALQQLVRLAAGDALAARYNVTATEESVLKAYEDAIESQFFSMRIQLQMQQRLKPDATDKEFEELFLKETGQTPAQAKERALESFKAQVLNDPNQRALAIREQAVPAVIDQVARTMTPSEDELKKSYENLSFNRLPITDPALTADQRKERAEKALKELQSGRAFNDVYKELVGGTVPTPTEIPRSQIDANADYEPLRSLKQNEAAIASEFGTTVVFQFVGSKTTLPPDFEKNKAKLMTDFAKGKAATQVQEEMKQLTEDKANIKWTSPVSGIIYDLYAEVTKMPANTTAEPYKAILDRITETEKGDVAQMSDMLDLARYVAFEEAFKNSSASEQIGMKEDRAKHMEAALLVVENGPLRLELAGLQQELKQPDAVVDSLSKAVEDTMTFTEPDVQFVLSVEKKAQDWQKSGFLNADQVEMVNIAIKTWRADKAAFDKDEAERLKMEEEARKQAEEDQKKLEAEAAAERKRLEEEDKKKAEEAKKSGAAPSATGATTGTTGTVPGLTTGQ